MPSPPPICHGLHVWYHGLELDLQYEETKAFLYLPALFVYRMHAWGPLELELQMVSGHHMDDSHQTWVP